MKTWHNMSITELTKMRSRLNEYIEKRIEIKRQEKKEKWKEIM